MHEGRGAVRDGKVSKTKRTRVNFTAAQVSFPNFDLLLLNKLCNICCKKL